MKQKTALVIILISFVLSCNTNKPSKHDGVYRYGDPTGEGPNGQVIVFTESDTSLLFYIDISRGAPSYNMGTLYGRISIKDGEGVFYSKEFAIDEEACKLSFTFYSDNLTIKTIGNNYECGFGGNVWADGTYAKVLDLKQDFFIDAQGGKYYFKETKPEQYN